MSDQGKYSQPQSNGSASSGQGLGDNDRIDSERLKDQGKEAAHDISDAAQHQAEHLYDNQRKAFAEQAHKFTDVMKKAADDFDNQQQPFFSQQVRKVANLADGFSNQLRDKDLRRICHDAQDYSRREPAIFIGGAIAAGFLAARFLRSSRSHDHGQYSERTTDMNTSGSRYSSQHVSSQGEGHNGGRNPAYGGALGEQRPTESDGLGASQRPLSTSRPGSDSSLGGDNSSGSKR
ncbi:hypothetical protein [Vreelandella sp. EE22]